MFKYKICLKFQVPCNVFNDNDTDSDSEKKTYDKRTSYRISKYVCDNNYNTITMTRLFKLYTTIQQSHQIILENSVKQLSSIGQ